MFRRFPKDIKDSLSKYGDEYNFLYSPLKKSLLTVPGMTVDLEEKFKKVYYDTTHKLMGYCLSISKDEGEMLKPEEVFEKFVDIYFYEMIDDSYHITINIKGKIKKMGYFNDKYRCVLTEEEKKRVKLVLYMILKKLEMFFSDFVEFPEEEEDMM